MPSKLKKLVRKRMAKTGERYATALARIRAQRVGPDRPAGVARASGACAVYEPELIVTRYFGQAVIFALLPVHGRCVLMLAPGARQPVLEVRQPRWQLLGQRGVQ